MARSFVDTNIFFYAVDGRDPAKQSRARALVADLASSGEGVVSTQVIQEFANNAMKKLEFTAQETIALCESFADHTIVRPDLELIMNALGQMKSASLSFWDACIVAAAEQAQCKILYTDDLTAGQRFGAVRVSNPFV